MIQLQILPEGCKTSDFERGTPRQHPQIPFVSTKSITPKGSPVKLKISKELTISIPMFNVDTEEQYMKLLEDFESVIHKKGFCTKFCIYE